MIATDRNSPRVPLAIPFGWYQVLYSSELAVGEAKPITYFDTDLVVFRTESGITKVIDAYCAHMGAHLGYGIREHAGSASAVVGENIVCPFHGWQFSGEGQCKHIPYATNLPPRVARGEQLIRPYPVREINQCILVWYHPDGIKPTFEPPVVPEAALDNEEWGDIKSFTWEISTHMQEIGENAVDAAHFHFVHGTNDIPDVLKQEFGEFTRHGLLKTRNETPRGVIEGFIENVSTGPGLSVIKFSGICDTLLLANLTQYTLSMRGLCTLLFRKRSMEKQFLGVLETLLLPTSDRKWKKISLFGTAKRYYEKPLLCDGDGPFAKFRKWYGQFIPDTPPPELRGHPN